jgi:hypothetical protein
MGTLVAMHYPTKLAFGAADHTYVMCGTGGKAWSCWGGKTGGAVLRSGSGSTSQADAIAAPNERAGVTCYLINGVCHQAANRILFPAGILVTGAKGYGVSSALFGPYGRPRGPLGICSAPFNQHTGVTGDLPACIAPTAGIKVADYARSSQEEAYITRVTQAYQQADVLALNAGTQLLSAKRAKTGKRKPGRHEGMLTGFMLELFDYQIDFKLSSQVDANRSGQLRDLRASTEKSRIDLENQFANRDIQVMEFVLRSDLEAINFQKQAARVLTPAQYEALFDLKPGHFIGLADPEIVPVAYPQLAL